MIYPVTGWLEITQYDDKIAIIIANLVETMWLTRYPSHWKSRMNKDHNLSVMSLENH